MVRLYQPINGRNKSINLPANPFIRSNNLFSYRDNPFNQRYKPMSGVGERFIALRKRLLLPVKRFNPQDKRTIPPVNWISPASKRLGGATQRIISAALEQSTL